MLMINEVDDLILLEVFLESESTFILPLWCLVAGLTRDA
jgi:hypothetical protein